LYDCCPITDGAASVILASEEKVKELKIDTPVWVAGIGYSSGTANLSKRLDYVGLEAAVYASRMAYKMAKITPDQVDFARGSRLLHNRRDYGLRGFRLLQQRRRRKTNT
jgi:acetyl-CoA C-acetyltransferase